ncbi:MAG: hypothetical protein ACFFE8_01945 [Candidatus Heimdallarchaeota archaeon]
MAPGIYLIIEFDWPGHITPEIRKNASELHRVVEDEEWIREVAAGSSGIGGMASSIWIFWLRDYSSLDILLRDKKNAIHRAYMEFFEKMINVSDQIKEEIIFEKD